jgi:hypothetical protein
MDGIVELMRLRIAAGEFRCHPRQTCWADPHRPMIANVIFALRRGAAAVSRPRTRSRGQRIVEDLALYQSLQAKVIREDRARTHLCPLGAEDTASCRLILGCSHKPASGEEKEGEVKR